MAWSSICPLANLDFAENVHCDAPICIVSGSTSPGHLSHIILVAKFTFLGLVWVRCWNSRSVSHRQYRSGIGRWQGKMCIETCCGANTGSMEVRPLRACEMIGGHVNIATLHWSDSNGGKPGMHPNSEVTASVQALAGVAWERRHRPTDGIQR